MWLYLLSLEEEDSQNTRQTNIPNPGQKELSLKDDPSDALKIGPERGFYESTCPEEAGEEEGECMLMVTYYYI